MTGFEPEEFSGLEMLARERARAKIHPEAQVIEAFVGYIAAKHRTMSDVWLYDGDGQLHRRHFSNAHIKRFNAEYIAGLPVAFVVYKLHGCRDGALITLAEADQLVRIRMHPPEERASRKDASEPQ